MAKKQKTDEPDQPFLFGEMDQVRAILNEEAALLHAEEEKIQKQLRKKGEDLVYIQARIKKIKKGIEVLSPPSEESMADADAEEEPKARVEIVDEDQDEETAEEELDEEDQEEDLDSEKEEETEDEDEPPEDDDDLDDEFEEDEDFDDYEDDKD